MPTSFSSSWNSPGGAGGSESSSRDQYSGEGGLSAWGPTFGGTGETDYRLALKNKFQKDLVDAGNAPALAAEAGRNSRFNTAFGFGQQALAGLQNQFATAGGQNRTAPEISVGGVLNPQQIQSQVNAQRAHNDQSLGTQQLGQANQLAGQGFGANSPLLNSLYSQGSAANRALNSTNERETRLGAAQANAGQLLQSQQAREAQSHSMADEDIRRRAPIYQAYSGLLNALTSMG